MTVAERQLVKADGVDGGKWCTVYKEGERGQSKYSGQRFWETTCGQVVTESDLKDHSPTGELPEDLSGTTICYDCANSHRQEAGQ